MRYPSLWSAAKTLPLAAALLAGAIDPYRELATARRAAGAGVDGTPALRIV
jgi:hypothetical protein